MICLKCGNEIKDNEQICSNCGYNKNQTIKEDNPYGIRNQGIYNQNPVDINKANERLEHQKQFNELTEIYIGNKYYNFQKGKFSFCALFLGPLYYMYRKMYGVGIIVYILELIVNYIFSLFYKLSPEELESIIRAIINGNFTASFASPLKYILVITIPILVVRLFEGLTFKKFYFDNAIEKVAEVKQKNPDLGFNQLTELIRKKGGVNILAPILMLLVPILLIIILFLLSIFNILKFTI